MEIAANWIMTGQSLELYRKAETVVADNLANWETPGFQAQRLSFRRALAAAWQAGGGPVRARLQAVPGSLRPDGSSVDLTAQMAQLAQLQLGFDLAAQALSIKGAEMTTVTAGKVS
ncbi:Flagellar basal body rod protein FlgB [Candidatus Hydrogenisulfobacillus filiaventi]|uniref:Flagellar basal body rod protein FlgB n=1 Tax=Candidatus Hydrogenisulfobacillus filiaventi TaxID=2707344 RepID=A0A6F8ZDB6_9FIRM|nr:flagellar basal body rod protein [Bacillota bacterium]CAB1128006.1 Flagellar basal body rod protein FlgB [Candidatus Hydrogenisulfobacillus filiaventi]